MADAIAVDQGGDGDDVEASPGAGHKIAAGDVAVGASIRLEEVSGDARGEGGRGFVRLAAEEVVEGGERIGRGRGVDRGGEPDGGIAAEAVGGAEGRGEVADVAGKIPKFIQTVEGGLAEKVDEVVVLAIDEAEDDVPVDGSKIGLAERGGDGGTGGGDTNEGLQSGDGISAESGHDAVERSAAVGVEGADGERNVGGGAEEVEPVLTFGGRRGAAVDEGEAEDVVVDNAGEGGGLVVAEGLEKAGEAEERGGIGAGGVMITGGGALARAREQGAGKSLDAGGSGVVENEGERGEARGLIEQGEGGVILVKPVGDVGVFGAGPKGGGKAVESVGDADVSGGVEGVVLERLPGGKGFLEERRGIGGGGDSGNLAEVGGVIDGAIWEEGRFDPGGLFADDEGEGGRGGGRGGEY